MNGTAERGGGADGQVEIIENPVEGDEGLAHLLGGEVISQEIPQKSPVPKIITPMSL